jgi:putative two-component system response regulator
MEENRKLLKAFLTHMRFATDIASSGREALERVEESPPDVILLDLVMPDLSGFEVCRALKGNSATRHIPIIIITGMSDRDANVMALEAGADDFVLKPFDSVLLKARLQSAIQTKQLHDELLQNQQDLEDRVKERTKQVERSQQVTVFSLAKLSESRDNETGDHLDRMRSYARVVATELVGWDKFQGMIDESFVLELYESSPLHDIGKVGIPDAILLKPGKLSDEEFEIMKTHASIGGDTLKAAQIEAGDDTLLSMGRDNAYFHHEKWDGSGYPFGLKELEIPLSARITALADVYDALSSKRPYKEPFSQEKSRSIILEGRGTHFDEDVVKAFLAREREFIEIRDRFTSTGRLSPIHVANEKVKKLTAV